MVLIDRWVTPDAQGNGDGSKDNPWTFMEARAKATEGDRVNVKAGTYALDCNIQTASGVVWAFA